MSSHAAGREFDIIARHFKPLADGDTGALGLGDDAALLDVPAGQQLVVTTDALVSGVHFMENLGAADIAHKVVGANISDLAAMGARPRAVFLAAQFPPDIDERWIAAFASGLGEALGESGAVLMGGDTVSTPGPLSFTMTALGFVARGRALKRRGARAGERVYVTGTIGDGALGLLCLRSKLAHNDHLIHRYARPEPRWAFAVALARDALASACADISDGLVADAGHIARASDVSITLEAARVPLSRAARRCVQGDGALIETILGGGDDYELIFTAAAAQEEAIMALGRENEVAVTCIGQTGPTGTSATQRVTVRDERGKVMELGAGGYRHL